MLSVGEACLLGAVQGLTEFLPVSSSGHLAVVHHMVRPLPAADMAAVDVALHVGTLVAVVAYFWSDLTAMGWSLLTGEGTWERRWIWLLALGSVPAGLLGLVLRDRIHASFGSLAVVGTCFLLTGTLLWLADRPRPARRDSESLGPMDAVQIGCFQALALFPGISRSGATISAGLLRGIRREAAARFGFLLGIPAIVGAQLSEARTLAGLGRPDLIAVGLGMVVAAVTGLGAIGALMWLVRSDRMHYFSYYLWPLGLVVLGVAVVEGV